VRHPHRLVLCQGVQAVSLEQEQRCHNTTVSGIVVTWLLR
jgi:hypothetical protein